MSFGGYFAGDYFGLVNPPVASPEVVPLSDSQCLKWIYRSLDAFQIFAAIGVGKTPANLAGGLYPAAWVFPIGFTEDDKYDPVSLTRTFRFGVVVTVQSSDDFEALDKLDALSSLVADLVSGDGPEGYLPALSRVESGRYDSAKLNDGVPQLGPENTALHSVTMLGSMAYLVEGRNARVILGD